MSAHRISALLALLVSLGTSSASAQTSSAPATPAAGSQPAATVSRTQFGRLRWLEGSWRGSGGSYTAFFERYRFLNDSTIEVGHYTAADMQTRSEPDATIELRGGRVRYGRSVATEVTPTSIAFSSANGGAFAFRKQTQKQWTATLQPRPGSSAKPTVYTMMRF